MLSRGGSVLDIFMEIRASSLASPSTHPHIAGSPLSRLNNSEGLHGFEVGSISISPRTPSLRPAVVGVGLNSGDPLPIQANNKPAIKRRLVVMIPHKE